MKNHGDYISGPHDFWSHFGFGLIFGALVSTSISLWFFESAAPILVTTGVGALVIAYVCGRWGDSVWYWMLKCLPFLRSN